uniref:Uncharacterized protein n=1 Tax=Timema genevievae TaxID=629358 RepID=A0A7R9K5L5_TIMGE|nr:unnamed protein product [Timema genevievae]
MCCCSPPGALVTGGPQSAELCQHYDSWRAVSPGCSQYPPVLQTAQTLPGLPPSCAFMSSTGMPTGYNSGHQTSPMSVANYSMSEEGVTKKRTGSEKHKGASANLERDDFGAGPTNLDCIEPGLWLGNITAATDDVALEQRRINHILTVDSCPLPRKMVMQQGIKTLFIQVTDTPREDLLSHFEDTYRFISEGQERGVVLTILTCVSPAGTRARHGSGKLVSFDHTHLCESCRNKSEAWFWYIDHTHLCESCRNKSKVWFWYIGEFRPYSLVYFGVSRSATIVIAYMMKKHGLSFEDALERYEDVCLLPVEL